jgi:hypothetical protein
VGYSATTGKTKDRLLANPARRGGRILDADSNYPKNEMRRKCLERAERRGVEELCDLGKMPLSLVGTANGEAGEKPGPVGIGNGS